MNGDTAVSTYIGKSVPQASKRPPFAGIRRNVRRAAVTLLSLISRSWIPFLILGLVNRAVRRVDSVFFCYAGSRRYAEHYCWSQHKDWMQWFPNMIGLFKQGGRWGLVCGSPVTEADFMDPANEKHLVRLIARLERIRKLLGARQLSLAGILPGFLAQRLAEPAPRSTADYTAQMVVRAIQRVRHEYFGEQAHPVLLLGGAGRVGRAVRSLLRQEGIEPRVIDPAAGQTEENPGVQRLLVVDVSRHNVLEQYVDQLPAGSVVLNEVFPEPRLRVLEALRRRGVQVLHIAGVRATVLPPLPFGYSGAVPCCAIHAPDFAEPVLKRLV